MGSRPGVGAEWQPDQQSQTGILFFFTPKIVFKYQLNVKHSCTILFLYLNALNELQIIGAISVTHLTCSLLVEP